MGGSSTQPGINVFYDETYNAFQFSAREPATSLFYFPDIASIQTYIDVIQPEGVTLTGILKCYKVLGMDVNNSDPANNQVSNTQINFLYTPYVDIFSTALTKYQKVKDNTTNSTSDSTLVARIFLSGGGNPVNTGGEKPSTFYPPPQNNVAPVGVPITNMAYPLGSRPFIVIQDCNTPKVIRWSRDETVYAVDFQLRDQYGDLLFSQFTNPETSVLNAYYTEFQMTLLCVEGERA